MVIKSVSLLAKNPSPTEEEIRAGLEGSICRCTGYVKIVEAVDAAGKVMAAAAN
jgi:carbon-monoxide dehydrogenase small subunit